MRRKTRTKPAASFNVSLNLLQADGLNHSSSWRSNQVVGHHLASGMHKTQKCSRSFRHAFSQTAEELGDKHTTPCGSDYTLLHTDTHKQGILCTLDCLHSELIVLDEMIYLQNCFKWLKNEKKDCVLKKQTKKTVQVFYWWSGDCESGRAKQMSWGVSRSKAC